MKKTILPLFLSLFIAISTTLPAYAAETFDSEEEPKSETEAEIEIEPERPTYLRPVINTEDAVGIKKSTIFDASQSFIPNPNREILYEWDFGDGNKNQGVEVLHVYKQPRDYRVTLTIDDGVNKISTIKNIFAYRKMILLITDNSEDQERIEQIKEEAKMQGVYIQVIDSFGSSTDFISEEILTQKITEQTSSLQKADHILIWTKESAGLNALSRFMQKNISKEEINLEQRTIIVLEDNVLNNVNRIQRQFSLLNPQEIVVAQEGALFLLIEAKDDQDFLKELQSKGYDHEIIDAKSSEIKPWKIMSHFVNILIDQGIPDNTIALLLILPVIATVVAVMRQVVGMTTYGIYTPSIITLSFMIIGIYAGLLTLAAAIFIASLARILLKRVRMLFIPKMAIVITLVTLVLFILLISGIYLNLFDAQFLSIAIFPMLILSTLVEKFVTTKSGKGLSSAGFIMLSTVIVSIIAYITAGGEINLGFKILKFQAIENLMLNYPEIIFVIIVFNFMLGKWTGIRIMERIKFREILRHTEE